MVSKPHIYIAYSSLLFCTNSWKSRHPVDSPALTLIELALTGLSGVLSGAEEPV